MNDSDPFPRPTLILIIEVQTVKIQIKERMGRMTTNQATSMPISIAVDVNDKWLYRAAGIFAWALTLVFVIELGLGVALGKLPGSSGRSEERCVGKECVP